MTCISFITGGKRNEKLILPTNPSLSVTLGQNEVSNKAFAVAYHEASSR